MRVSVVMLRRFFWFYLVVQIIIFIFATIANHRESSVRKDIIDSTHEVLSHEHDRMIKLGFKGKPPPGHRQCVDLESLGGGKIPVKFSVTSMDSIIKMHSAMFDGEVEKGGWWKPKSCQARQTVAIMIPFRKREEQLMIFLNHMHPILQRQQLSYQIFVIDQAGTANFNKGALYNVGFMETNKFNNFGCYIFHDVDLLLENYGNDYGCPHSPIHMSPAIDKFDYMLPYMGLFGGVEGFSKEHFKMINGFSNSYWGWGAEDDDLYMRIRKSGLKLFRPPPQFARYTMNHHKHYQSSLLNPFGKILLEFAHSRSSIDGLNNVHEFIRSKTVEELPLYTLVRVKFK